MVGAGADAPSLAEAARAANAGDTIRLAPGEYFSCATLLADDLVLEGAGPTTRVTDAVCEGKALLVVRGANLVVRDLVLARARSPDKNGAGIRLEAQSLTLERVGFENNEVGVLAGQEGAGAIRVTDCRFERGGVTGDRPAAALQIGGASLLRVERSTFTGVKGGQVLSGAARTELAGNRIEAGDVEAGGVQAGGVQAGGVEASDVQARSVSSAAFAVQAAGTLVMQDNVLVLGHAFSRGAAVLATGSAAALRANRLDNRTGRPQALLLDWTRNEAPVLAGNAVADGDALVSRQGYWRHRAGEAAHGVFAMVHTAAGSARRAIRAVLGR